MVEQTVNPDETVLAREKGAALVVTDDRTETDAVVRFEGDGPVSTREREFDEIDDARLLFGLWVRTGPWEWPDNEAFVPRPVSLDSRAALASYMLVAEGGRIPAAEVRNEMELETTQAIRNYANEIRTEIQHEED